MKIEWYEQNYHNLSYDRLILAGDVGGTNTSIALMAQREGRFDIIVKAVFASRAISSCLEALQQTLVAIHHNQPHLVPQLCCISAAGPVANNRCHITNLPWNINGKEIEQVTGIKTRIINDFMAVSYSLPLLDVNNPQQIATLTPVQAGKPQATSQTSQLDNGGMAMRAVVGAGTGLGVGFLIEQSRNNDPNQKTYIACPSEGGHIGFADFDEQTAALNTFISKELGKIPDAEHLVSGPGLVRIFNFLQQQLPGETLPEELASSPDSEKPALICKYAYEETLCPLCKNSVELFIKVYARFASDIAAVTIPRKGLYLAGGIVMKNAIFFTKTDLFRRFFVQNPRENIGKMLAEIPVYIIRDYATSLYGAAHAGVCLFAG